MRVRRSAVRRRRSWWALAALPCSLAGALALAPAALAVAPETPETKAPTSITASSAVFNGVLNPGAAPQAGTYQFLYRKSASECQGESATPPALAAGLKEEAVAEPLATLEPNTEYTVCLQARNVAEEVSALAPVTFKTALRPEVPEGLKAEPLASFSATLKGVLNPKAPGDPGSYEFRLRQSGSECEGEGERRVPEPAKLATGAEGEPAEAEVTGLLPHTTYTFCLRASNSVTPEPEATLSPPATFTTPAAAPQIEDAVANVAATSATLTATLNPEGAPSTYAFEYAPAGGAFTPVLEPEGQGSLPEGTSGVPLSVHVVQGLLPNSSYEFRLVAKSSAAPQGVVGEVVSFTTQPPGGELVLPDGRQWEMVTPPDKHGALFFGLHKGLIGLAFPFVAQAAAAGDAIVDLASQPTEQLIGNTNEISILSTREETGWSSQVIAPPHAQGTGVSIGNGAEYRLFSEDLSLGAVQQFGNFTPLSPEASESTPYLHSDYLNGDVSEHCQSSCFQALVTRADTQEGAVFGGEVHGECSPEQFKCGPGFLDGSADLGHVLLSGPAGLTATPNEGNFYEWGGGQLQPLYLLPKSEGGVGVNGEPPDQRELAYHQLSEDGSLFFTYHGHLYLHDFSKGESARLDVAQGVVEPTTAGAEFLYASSDGSRVLFSDSQQLTTAPGGGVYECRIVGLSCELELTGLSGRPYHIEGSPQEEGEKLAVGSLLGGSRDASYLYFMGAGEKLTVDYYEGGKWTTSEGPLIPQSRTSGFVSSSGVDQNMATYRISPNGRFVAFMSDQKLTGYDNRDAVSGQPDEEVYLYEAASNRLVCASCDPTGARPVGAQSVAASVPPWEHSTGGEKNSELYQPRYLSDSGRLFFDSHDALVPQDVNGTEDVYQFEPVGVPAGEHACSVQSATFSARSGGCVSLISRGDSPEESSFLDASESGADVFFLTTSKLAPQDYDTAPDVYDAHECTSVSPCTSAPVQPPPCDTEASCKPSPTPQPAIYGAPASATFAGPGDLAGTSPPAASRGLTKKAAKCRRGYVKNGKSKCVRSRSKKRKAKRASRAGNERRAK